MTAGDPSEGSPTTQPGADDESPASSQQPAADTTPNPASSPGPAADPPADPPASTPATVSSTAPDGAPADATPATGDEPTSSTDPDSTKDDCAEIPTAAHVVLEAEIKLVVRIPRPVDEAQQMPHQFMLANDDGSVNVTVAASTAVAGDVDGTSLITFTGLAEHHKYTLQCDNASTPVYTILQDEPYESIGEDDGAQDSSPAYGDCGVSDSYDNGINAE